MLNIAVHGGSITGGEIVDGLKPVSNVAKWGDAKRGFPPGHNLRMTHGLSLEPSGENDALGITEDPEYDWTCWLGLDHSTTRPPVVNNCFHAATINLEQSSRPWTELTRQRCPVSQA